MTVASLETEFKIEFLSTNIIQTGLTILVKNLVLQTIQRFNKMSRQVLDICPFFWRYSVGTFCDTSKERIDTNRLRFFPCVTCYYRVRKRRWLYFDVETSERCRKENQYIHAVLVLATNSPCGACAASLAKLTRACFFP